MCGIVGYFSFKNHQKHQDDLKEAVQSLSHRGPDNSSLWVENDVGFGHTRLSIIDLSAEANQPMVSYSGRYVISFNGQIYNFPEVAKLLKQEIYSCSDTRVLVEIIEEFGIEKAVPLLNGMFAFALWDTQEKELHLVRDSIGIKPLYWASTEDGYLFGSEIKSLKTFSSFENTICTNGLKSYFANKAIYAPYSIYKNCYKLLPGHIMTIDKNGQTMKEFFPKVSDYSHIKTLEDADECFENLLRGSIQRHSRSDVPFSAFLSGGIDSGLIVSILSETQSFKTYSIGYEEKEFDESKKAKKIASALGLDHETLILSPENVFSSLDKIPEIYDEPFADSSCLPTYLLSKEVSKNTKVVFSGDGADELFAGYPRYFNAVNQWAKIRLIPYSVRNSILKNIIPNDSNYINFFAQFFLKNPKQSLPYIKKVCGHKTIWELFCADNSLMLPVAAFSNEIDWKNYATQYFSYSISGESPLKTLLRQDQKFRLPDEMLTKVDRASMANSLEVRVPFLDNEVVAFSRSLQDSLLGENGTQKILLRRLLSKYLDKDLFCGAKMGFHIPMKIWLKTHYSQWAEDLLFGNLSKTSFFNQDELKKIWALYCEGNTELFYPLWSIIMYNQCARKSNF